MSIFNNFLAVLLASTTSFTGSIIDAPLKPSVEQVQTTIQSSIDEATSIAQSSGMNVGIAVIDRAKNNSMRTNAEYSHKQFPLESLGRLHILLYSVINDPNVVKGNVSEITSMMQGYSGNDTKDMWEKYGGTQIISDLAERYNLQETTANDSWGTSTSSAVDVARLYRRFLDDKRVSNESKKWVISLLRDTSLEVSGQDYSFGLPAAREDKDSSQYSSETDSEQKFLAFAQGSSSSGSDPMVRSTSGIIDESMRYIVVILGEVPSNTTDSDANTIMSQVATAVGTDEALGVQNQNSDKDQDVQKFLKKQYSNFGDFVGNEVK